MKTPDRRSAILDGMEIPTPQDRTPQDRGAGPAADADDQAGYVFWPYIGLQSVYFYRPGSVQEHLVTEHGIPSVDMHRQVKGAYDHQGDHLKQMGVRVGAVGGLLAVAHPHEEAA
jgi:hypothetical protein